MASLFFIPIRQDLSRSSMEEIAAAELLGFETMKELFGPELACRAQEVASRLDSHHFHRRSDRKCKKSRDWFNRYTKSRESFNKCTKNTEESSYINNEKEFKVSLDVKEFNAEELKITVDGGYVTVEGQQEERSDEQGSVSRQFIRKYNLPDDVDQDSLHSTLSSNGLLVLTASKKKKEEEVSCIEVPIFRPNRAPGSEEQDDQAN